MAESDDDAPTPPDRDDVLAMLDEAIEEAHRKVTSGRVRDAENEKVRQGWIRALGYAVGQYRQLKRDKDLDEMKERLERLEEQADGGGRP